MSSVSDGTSNTIAVIEDAGRTCPRSAVVSYGGTEGSYIDPNSITGVIDTVYDTVATTPTTGSASGICMRGVWRWCDPDAGGSGLSGPTATASATGLTSETGAYVNGYFGKVINQNNYPIGGPAGHLWTSNNQGLNDEPFSFHPGGCNCAMMDGSVRFLSESIHPVTLRYLVTRSEQKTTSDDLVVGQPGPPNSVHW